MSARRDCLRALDRFVPSNTPVFLHSNHWDNAQAPSLPSALEDKLPRKFTGRFAQAAAIVDFKLAQQKDIVGRILPIFLVFES